MLVEWEDRFDCADILLVGLVCAVSRRGEAEFADDVSQDGVA